MDGDFGRDGRPYVSLPVAALVSNLETDWMPLAVGAHVLPMTRNDGLRPTNYMCCPSGAYLDYACDELRHFQPVLAMALRALISLARPLMKASGLDRQVQPNNGLVATNLFPVLSLRISIKSPASSSDDIPIMRLSGARSMQPAQRS